MYQPLGEDPQTEDGKPTSLGSWGSSELRYLLMVSQNCGNPVRDTETLPSCTKHATYKRDSEAGDTQIHMMQGLVYVLCSADRAIWTSTCFPDFFMVFGIT